MMSMALSISSLVTTKAGVNLSVISWVALVISPFLNKILAN